MSNKIFYPVIIALLLFPFAVIAYLWSSIPDTIPIHYNINMEPDRWAPKAVGLFMLPCINIFVTVLLLVVPNIDPKGNLEKYINAYRSIVIALTILLTMIFSIQISGYAGYHVPFDYIPLSVVLLMAFVGNLMLKVKPNYFLGIRTPWTLENDEVWRRTHRIGGYLWVFASLIMLPFILFTPVEIYGKILMVYIGVITIIPIVYSYIAYRQETRTDPKG